MQGFEAEVSNIRYDKSSVTRRAVLNMFCCSSGMRCHSGSDYAPDPNSARINHITPDLVICIAEFHKAQNLIEPMCVYINL